MHIAAADPKWVRREDVPAEAIEKEKAIYRAQMESSGKPANVIDKIIEGKLGSFYAQFVLLDQPSIRDDNVDHRRSWSPQASAKTGENIQVSRFVRFRVGETRRNSSTVAARSGSRASRFGRRPEPSTMNRARRLIATRCLPTPPRPPVPVYNRVLLKLSGEALMGDQQFGVDPAVATRIARDVGDIQGLGVQTAIVIGGGNIFRGLAASARGMDRATGRLHGHAGHGDQRAGAAGRARAAQRRHPRGHRHRDARRGRAVHPPPRHPPPREGPRRHLRRRHRQPLLHHRHRGGAAGDGDQGRGHPQGHQGRRHLHRRPDARPDGDQVPRRSPTCRCSSGS